MSPNVELLDKVLKKIKDDRKHWYQGAWRHNDIDRDRPGPSIILDHGKEVLPIDCGTKFCFAGWAVQEGSEVKPKWCSTENLWATKYDNKGLDYPMVKISAAERAKRLLNLTSNQAGELFYGSNTYKDVKRIVGEIKSGELF